VSLFQISQKMGEKKKIAVLFSRYVAGEANQTEIEELLELVKGEHAGSDLEGEMEHFWNMQSGEAGDEVDWQRIYNRAVASDPKVISLKQGRRAWLSAAAAILVGICSIAAWFAVHQYTDQESLKYVTGKAKPGKTLMVFLSDGTKVTLNSGSQLRYPENFHGGKREVYLDGEAFFEVAHNPARSFLVHSGKVVTSVLGTSFNVMAYPKMSNLSVTVVTGKVAVKNTASEKMVTLTPKQRAILNTGKEGFSVDAVKDVADVIAWRKGELVFNHATLEEIALKLGNKYGIKIDINNKEKAGRKITGTFNKQSFTEIMDAVTHLTETHYKETTNNYIIY
jgi:transmembrane sensor